MIDVLIDEFIPNELTVTEIEKLNQSLVNREAINYLVSTDWYVTRFSETLTPIPPEVLAKRAESRSRIV